MQSFYKIRPDELANLGSKKLKRAFLEIIETNPKNELLLNVLQEHFQRDMFPKMNLQNLKSFMDQVGQDRVDNIDLTHFLNKNSNLFYFSQLSVVELLLSFKFRLKLQDLNAHFVDLESKNLGEIFGEKLALFSKEEMEDFLKSLIKEKVSKIETPEVTNQILTDNVREDSLNYMMRSNSVNNIQNESNFASKIREQLKSIVLRLVVLGYRFLCQQSCLDDLCAVLNQSENINFNINFWSKKLLVTLIYHYSDFELKSHVTKLLNANSTIPLVFYEVEEGRPPEILINPFFRFILNNQVGIGSFSIGFANNRKIGKTWLLNELFHTRFEINQNDPFNQLGIDFDLGEGFTPKRKLAVMDCNFDDFQSFRGMSKMINVVLISVSYLDFMQNFEHTRAQIEEIGAYMEKHKIHAIIIVRDWEQTWTSDDPREQLRGFESDGFAGKKEAPEELIAELKKYEKFLKSEKKRKKKENTESSESENSEERNESMDTKLGKVKFAKDNFDSLRKKVKGNFISYLTIKNLTNFDKSRRKEKVDKLKREINRIINAIPETERKFNQKCFEKFILHHSDVNSSMRLGGMKRHNQGRKQRGQITMEVAESNRKVKELYEDVQKLVEFSEENVTMEEEQVLPFNKYWKRKDELFKEIGKLGVNERNKKLKLERKIDRIERTIKKTRITDRLRTFKDIIIQSKYPIPLLSLFEDYLYRKMVERSNEENLSASKIYNKNSMLDINLYWRNLKPFLEPQRADLNTEEKKELIKLMETLFIKGYGFELIDGDHFIYWGAFLGNFYENLTQSDQFMTVSVKGPQSSGKSTLMNLQFGTNFKSGSGKCTSGINGYIMRFEHDFARFEQGVTSRKHFDESHSFDDERESISKDDIGELKDENVSIIPNLKQKNDLDQSIESENKRYILFLDSQGMMSEEQRGQEFDRKIGTFLLAVSQIILVNFMGDLNANFNDLLEVINFSYMKLDLGKRSLFSHNFKRNREGELESTDKAEQRDFQKILFVSNQNFNLGSSADIKKQKQSIQSNIGEIIYNISQTSEKYDASPIMLQNGEVAVEVLGNAFSQENISKDCDVGEEEEYSRKHIDQKFIRNFQSLKKNTVRQLVEIHGQQTEGERRVWTIGSLSENLGRIWNQIYYNLELYNMQSIKNKIVLNDYQQITQKALNMFINQSCLRHNFLTDFARDELDGREPPTDNLEDAQLYAKFKEVFGEESPKLVEVVRELEDSGEMGEFDERVEKCFEDDMKKMMNNVSGQMEKVGKKLIEWLEKKNTNRVQTVRKQMKWDEKKLFETYNTKFEFLEFFEGVHRHNFHFMCLERAIVPWARENKSRIKNQIEQNYLEYKEAHPNEFKNYLSLIQKKVENLKQNEVEQIRKMLTKGFTSNVENFILDNLNKIFRGLFTKFRGNESREFWDPNHFEQLANESLEEIRRDQFYIDTTLIKRFDYELEERFTNCEYLDFLGKEQVDMFKQVYKLPQSKEELVRILVDSLCQESPDSPQNVELEDLEKVMDDLEDFDILPKASRQNVAKLKMTGAKELKSALMELDWKMDKLDKDLVLLLNRKCPGILEHIMHKQKKELEWKPDPEVILEVKKLEWKKEHLAKLSLENQKTSQNKKILDRDFNYFFEPEKCASLGKIKKIFERVLSFSELQKTLPQNINSKVEQLLNSDKNPKEILQMNFFQMESLKKTLVDPILEELNREAKLHGASVSFALEEAVVVLVYQKVKLVLKAKFGEFVDCFVAEMMNWENGEIVEFITDKFIKMDMKKLVKKKYEEHLRILEEKLAERIQTRFTKFMEPSLKKIKQNFGNKHRLVRKFEEQMLNVETPNEQWMHSMYEYIDHPEKVLEREFEEMYEKIMSSVVDNTQKEKFTKKINGDLNYAIKYLSELKEFLKIHRISDDIKIVFTNAKMKVKEEDLPNLRKEFRYKFLKNIIEQGKLKPNYSTRIKRVPISIELESAQKDKLQFKKEKIIILPLIQNKFLIEKFDEFLDQILEFISQFQSKFNNDQKLHKQIFTLGHSKHHKQEIKEELIGCTKKCPFCNRMCEKELGHNSPHAADKMGHGIVNILNSSSKEKPRPSKTNLLNWPNLFAMELKFCDECAMENEEKVVLKEKEVKFSKLKFSGKYSEWFFGGGSKVENLRKGERFKNLCKLFWDHFGKEHCEKRNYLHKKSAPAPQIYLFTKLKLIGKLGQEKKKKRIYLEISKEVDDFNKFLLKIHAKSRFIFHSLQFKSKGKKTLLENYAKVIKNSTETRRKIPSKDEEFENEIENTHNFNIIIEQIRTNLTKKPNQRNFFIFGYDDLSKFSFEKLTCGSIEEICPNKNAYHAIIFSKNKPRKRSPKEIEFERFFGADCTTFVHSNQKKLSRETLIHEMVKILN